MVNPAPADAVQILGKEHLRILHVHDNMGTEDNHLDPFDGTVDRDEFSLSLKDIGFDGVLSLETNMKAPHGSKEQREAQELEPASKAKRLAGIL